MPETMQQVLRERSAEDQPAILHDDLVLDLARVRRRGVRTEAAALLALVDRERPVHVGMLLANSPADAPLHGRGRARRLRALRHQHDPPRCRAARPTSGGPSARCCSPTTSTCPCSSGAATSPRRTCGSSTPTRPSGPTCCDGAGALTPHREVEAMDTFMMIFTSGTSGDPKAVQVTHLMVLFSGLHLVEQVRRSPPTTSATSRCRSSTPTRSSAGWARRRVQRRGDGAGAVQRRRASSTTSAGTARRT